MAEIRNSGFYRGEHFILYPLPPRDPELMMTGDMIAHYGQAMHA